MSMQLFELRDLKKDFITARTNDEVHRSIELCPLAKEIMSTPQMQRMRFLHQLGTSNITYINTTHTRFEHSLGVMSLAEELLRAIKHRQPRLEITEKDIVCVKIAGLLHDIGHGPYSHVYDGVFRKQLKLAEAKGQWLGRKFDSTKIYKDMPEVMDGWAHEDASLMMIDAMLKGLGLEIDESNLDAPLKQIGDGIAARRFGIWDRTLEPEVLDCDDVDNKNKAPMPMEFVLTSRDWIFIKECIVGGPLPPKGVSIQIFQRSGHRSELIGRPNPHKEFLYNVVSNRYSGLDVDKMDYLARDTIRAHGSNCIADLLPKLIEKAFVAWASCDSAADDTDMHTMICYQDDMAQNIMSFFEQRFKEHQRLYTHGKTQRANYEICDILLLADPFFRISTFEDGDDIDSPPPDVVGLKLPISRAMVNPDTYLALTDNVLDQIMITDSIELRPARILIKRYRSHKLYKRIGTQIVGDESWTRALGEMEEVDIVNKILRLSSDMDMSDDDDGNTLVKDDIIVEKREIHHGKKAKNPVDFMRFVPKELHSQLLNRPENLPIAKPVPGSSYRKPDIFLQKAVRVFCRSSDEAKLKRLKECYNELIANLQNEKSDDRRFSVEIEEYVPHTPTRSSSAIAVSQETPPSVTQTPNKYDDFSSQTIKRGSFLDQVKKRSRYD